MLNLIWKTIHSQAGWNYQENRFTKSRRIISNNALYVDDSPHTWFLINCRPVCDSQGNWIDMINCFGTLKSVIDKRVIVPLQELKDSESNG